MTSKMEESWSRNLKENPDMKVKAYSSVLSLALVFILLACNGEQEPTHNNQQDIYQPKGEVIDLHLSGDLVSEQMRALDFTIKDGDKEGLPELKLPQAGSKVSVLCVLRKLGAPNSTTYAQLEWTVADDGKSLKYNGPVQLAEGNFTKADADKWYMMAILGGTAQNVTVGADVSKANVTVEAGNMQTPANGKLTMDVPYVMPWTKLSIITDDWAEHKSLRFYPQGTLVRHKIRNGMVDAYKVSAVKLSSNVMTNSGYFNIGRDNITDEQLKGKTTRQRADGTTQEYSGVLPVWMPKTAGQAYDVDMTNYTADSRMWRQSLWPVYSPEAFTAQTGTTYYSSYTLPSEVTIASGATSEGYYAWVMPMSTTETPRSDFYLSAQSTVEGSQLYEALPAYTTKMKPLSGVFYRIYPEISSDLIVSEVVNISYGQSDVSADMEDDDLLSGDNLDADGGWETAETPTVPGTAGGEGLGGRPEKNLSMVELYNPTLDTLDLNNYAIVRTFLPQNTSYGAFTKQVFHVQGAEPVDNPMGATALPLAVFTGSASLTSSPFSTWTSTGQHGTPTTAGKTRYRVLAGETNLQNQGLKILPGKTVLIGASSYLKEDNPAQNSATDKARREILAIVKKAVEKGYCQYAIAYSNGAELGDSFADAPSDKTAGTLDFGATDGIVLIKKGTGYQIVDVTTPSLPSVYKGNNSKYQNDFDLFKARYRDNESSSPRLRVIYPYQGYYRQRGCNHPAVPPFYGAVGQGYVPYTQMWISVQRDSYSSRTVPIADSYTYGHRYEQVSETTATFTKPALRPWPRKTK